jgi:hypothetical protein
MIIPNSVSCFLKEHGYMPDPIYGWWETNRICIVDLSDLAKIRDVYDIPKVLAAINEVPCDYEVHKAEGFGSSTGKWLHQSLKPFLILLLQADWGDQTGRDP